MIQLIFTGFLLCPCPSFLFNRSWLLALHLFSLASLFDFCLAFGCDIDSLAGKLQSAEVHSEMKSKEGMNYRCVECGFPIKTLFVQYSPGNIRLMKCGNCKAVADEYIECELMIILIDLVLHKQKAYRYLLYNVLHRESMNIEGLVWTLSVAFLLLDAYRSLLLQGNEEQRGVSLSFSFLVLRFQKVFVHAFVGNLIVFCFFLLAMKILLNRSVEISRWRHVFGAMVVSSYFKIFLIAMMIWEYPSSAIFIIDLFIFSSNTVALKVITKCDLKRCIATCFIAHAAKLLVTQLPMLLP